jgi:hypothetical protein
MLFPVKDAMMYVQSQPIGGRAKAFQGETYYTADNPPYGAILTYYLKESPKTLKQRRQEAERDADRRSQPVRIPSAEELWAEEEEEAPAIVFTISDPSGRVVRRLTGPASPGINRVAWDLRYPAPTLAAQRPPDADDDFFGEPPGGPSVMPGRYKVSVARRAGGVTTPLSSPQEFTVYVEGQDRMTPEDRAALVEFQQKVARLQRALAGTMDIANQAKTRLGLIRRALQETPAADAKLMSDATAIEKQVNEILRALRGDVAARARNENTPPSISERVGSALGSSRTSTARPTKTQMEQYSVAAKEFEQALGQLRSLVEGDLARLEKAMEAAGAPYTPGRLPEWKDQ